MAMNPRLLRPTANDSPASIPGLALWLDASASDALYTTDAGPVTAVGSPLDISGCVGWWDASDASSISDTSGSVDQWSDKSGQGNHVTASTTARPTTGTRTLNGLNVLDFDGTNDVLALGGYTFSSIVTSRAVSVFCVMASDDPNAVRRVMSLQRTGKNSNDTGVFIGRHTNLSGSIDFATGAGDSATNDQVDKNLINVFADASSSPSIYGFSVSAAANSKKMFKAGAENATTVRLGTLSASGFLGEGSGNHTIDIGASRNSGNTLGGFWDGYVAEIIVYDSALSTSDRARVEAYLAAKWGISNVHAPAVTASDPVGYWRDRSGNGRHATQSTAASRPRVASASVNGRRVAEWHSSTSQMQIAGAGALANTMSMFAVAKRGPSNWGGGGGGGYGTILSIGSSSSGPAMRAANGVIGMLGGTNESTFAPSGGLGVTAHALFGGTLNSLASSLYVNGALVDSDAAAGSVGGASNTAIGAFSAITGGGGPLNAELAEIISYNRLLSTAERRKVERYLARRWGITLAPQVSNAEAQDWISRVYANGGTVSQSTASAVSAMCDAIETAGIRDRFYRLNLFCGDNLNAALVPLYRGPAYSPDGLGAELWSVSTPSITNASGSNGSWDGSTLTMTNTGTGTDGSFPRFSFSLPLTTGKRYAVSGTLTGDKSAVAYIRLASSGSLTDITYNSTTGAFSATAATASAAHIQFLMNATLGTKSVSIASLSVREVLTYGNATDTNNAFVGVGTDYAETGASGGLTGNGSTKYLLTGLTTAALPSLATGHLSVYAATYPTSGIRGLLTSWGSGFGNPLYVLEANRNGAGDLMTAWGDNFGGRNFAAASGIGAGHLISSRVSGTDLRVFRSGAQVGSTVTASVTPAANTGSGFAVFANYGSAAANYSDARLGAYSVGAGLDSTQAAAYYTAMQAFQAALGRNV